MTVAELIASELGVEVGEKFEYENNTYTLRESGLIDTFNCFTFNSIFANDILTNKDKIVKINNLADSWNIKNDDIGYYTTSYGTIAECKVVDRDKEIASANKNEEYMQLIANKQNLFRKMLKFADCNNGEFNGEEKYVIYYTSTLGKWTMGCTYVTYNVSDVYFSSEGIAQKTLEQFEYELESIRLAEIKMRRIK